MCGIAGIVGPLRDRSLRVDRMTRAIAHRGPDGEGRWDDDDCSLGHRRLAILDLGPTGRQPMASDDGSVVIVYNGEAYDFADHRAALASRGHHFRSRSDTEVMLALYREHGPRFASRVEGMFAFAVWDAKLRQLTLGRDRFGQKPLYVSSLPGGAIAFASEIGALLTIPELDDARDPEAIDDLLTLHFVSAPRTMYRAIRRVPRASVLVRQHDGTTSTSPLDLPARPRRAAQSFAASVERTDQSLRAAVRRTLVSDVPVGLFLSGGIDSSLIASYLADTGVGPVSAFTATFGASPTDELQYAREVGARLGLQVTPVSISPTAYLDPEQLVDRFDEPFADVAAVPTMLLAREARSTITVAMTGDGGDEVFGGYEHHVATYWWAAMRSQIGGPLANALGSVTGAAAPFIPPGARGRSGLRTLRRLLELTSARSPRELVVSLRATLRPTERNLLLGPALRTALRGRDPYAPILPPSGDVQDVFDPDADEFLPELFMRKTDVSTMASGLEARAPLLDREVVETARALPLDHLVAGHRGKRVLRALLERRIGRDLARRRKMGFAPPVSDWLRQELSPLMHDTLLTPGARIAELVSATRVAELAAEHGSRMADHRRILWALLLLELWLRRRAPRVIE